MPQVTVVSTTGGTTVYTSDHGTTNAPDHFVYRNADGETGDVAVISPKRGDDSFADGVIIKAGETYAEDLMADQSVTLIAKTGSVNGTFKVTEY